MKAFEIGPLMEQIQLAIEEGREPDPALVELLCQEGPRAVEEWWDAIDMVQSDVTVLAERIKALKERKDAREQTVDRMKSVLLNVLNNHFEGKIRTPLLTCWTQKTTTYEVTGADPIKNPTFFKFPEPELKKSVVVQVYKDGGLPDNVSVSEGFSESVRVKR